MMAVKLLVKIAVMMMAPGGAPAPPEARGREPPSFFFFLDLLPRWEKGFPSGPWSPWRGRGESPSEIGSVSLSLSVSAFSDSSLSPFLIFPEIRNSDWAEILTRSLSGYQLSCGERRAPTALRCDHKGPGRALPPGARPSPSWAPRASSRVDSTSQNSHKFQKNLSLFLFRLDSVRYGYSAKQKTCNKQELALGTGSICQSQKQYKKLPKVYES